MKAQGKDDSSRWLGMPRWLAVFVGVAAIASFGFLLWLTAQTFSRSSTLDARRVRALNIAADYIAKWPAVATTIGQTSLYHRGKNDPTTETGPGNTFYAYLYHPEFGDFQVRYDRGQKECDTKVEIYKNRLTVKGEALQASATASEPEKTYIDTARKASWVSLEGVVNPVCFTIANLDLKRVAPPLGGFSHLLLIEDPGSSDSASAGEQQGANGRGSWRDGRVVGWVGPSELPIRRLSDLPALESEVSSVVTATAREYLSKQAAIQKSDDGPTDALEPFDSRIAGKGYRFYWRPIVLDMPGRSTGAEQLTNYYLVGVAPNRVAPEPGRSRIEVLAFALALFMLVALMPVVKLAMLGPVDSMKAIEVAAISLGIVAAAALGTALWIGVRDVSVARNASSPEVALTAARLVQGIDRDLRGTLLSGEMEKISQNLGDTSSGKLVAGFAPDIPPTEDAKIARVENLVLLDAHGKQAAGTVMNAARDHVGANFDLSDRIYFRRAMEQDFAPGSAELAAIRRGKNECAIWNMISDGLVFEQVRSRTDGAPKTIISAAVRPPAQMPDKCRLGRPVPFAGNERLQPKVIVAAFVMPSMLSPDVEPGVRYAVVDLWPGADGRPVLFHSDSYRAGVEQFDESLNAATRSRLASETREPVPCKRANHVSTKQFTGIYEEAATLFAVARVPCTDWAVVAFKSRRLVDSQAVKPAVHAAVVWASLMVLPYFLWMVIAWRFGDHAWVWLWPEPGKRKKEAYFTLSLFLASAAGLSAVLIAVAAPFIGFLISIGAAIAALAWLAWVHHEQRIRDLLVRAQSVREEVGSGGAKRSQPEWLQSKLLMWLDSAGSLASQPARKANEERKNEPLDESTERRFLAFIVTLLIVVSVAPIASLSADARAYFSQVSAAERHSVLHSQDRARAELRSEIARMEGIETLPVDNGVERTAGRGEQTADGAERPRYFTEHLRKAAGYESGITPREAKPTHWLMGWSHLRFLDRFILFWLALVFVVIMVLAVWASARGLFGFGVALEAVEYPQLDVEPDGKGGWRILNDLPPRFLVIRANENHLKALKKNALQMDIYEDIQTKRDLQLPERGAGEPKLLLIHNLGLLLGDPAGRRSALERLEQILVRQRNDQPDANGIEQPNFRIAILTSLTPLDRLLQSFERERDENDQLGEEQKTLARLERAKYREDMRWSAVFEQFTTYYHAARPRKAPAELASKSDAVKLVWKELEYIPDSAVSAMIWDPGPPVLTDEIIHWAEKITKNTAQPRAIVDYLASNLIEHYHLMWALSSRAERLLLYRIAHGHVPNVAKAYALRSLVKRGLVVLAPYPRTMNKSFAQFVQHVEKPDTIKNWRQTQEHGFWDAVRLPFVLGLPVAIAVLVVATIRNGDSLAAIIPLIVASGPALINALSSARRTAAA